MGRMTEQRTQPEVNLGKAAIFFAVLAVFGLIAGAFAPFYGFIGVLAAIMTAGLAFLHFANRRRR